jgi:murein DD-endopeptidase MepM/ murein hydrolase activator NlpD
LRLVRGRAAGPRTSSSTPLLISRRLASRFCATPPAPRPAKPSAPAIEIEDGLLLAPVGPARVPTRLFVAVPAFDGEVVDFAWPVDGVIASAFGRRHEGWHAGIDIMAAAGAPVQAAAAGVVQYSGWAGTYGRLVTIEHPGGFLTLYAHNDEVLVHAGDEVAAGTAIATVGRTGKASGEHLHFEIRRNGMAYNPLHLLAPRDGPPILASMAEPSSELPLEPLDATAPVGEPGAP